MYTGSQMKAPGQSCGSGLTQAAAQKLGLEIGTPVGTSIIDAHAGGLGLLGCGAPGVSSDFISRIGITTSLSAILL